jgi:hypothetical protein
VAFAPLASAQTVGQLIPHKVKLQSVDYRGSGRLKITEDGQVANGEAYAIMKGTLFHNGSIEVELAGSPAADAIKRQVIHDPKLRKVCRDRRSPSSE